jgi:hypothetical protein
VGVMLDGASRKNRGIFEAPRGTFGKKTKEKQKRGGGKIPKSETPGSDIRNLPGRSEIADR